MRMPAVIFAILTLAISTIWILACHMLGYNTTRHDIGQYTRMFPMIFFWLMIIGAIYYQRRKHGHVLSFSEGFKTGLVMTLIYCAGFTIVIILYQQFLNPEYHDTLKAFTLKTLQEKGAAQQEIDEKLKQLEMSAGGSAISYLLLFIFSSIWGIGISAIAALLLRRQPKV